jgi:hypothetical protein
MSSTSTDLDDIRLLIALETSESETGANGKNSEDDEIGGGGGGGKTTEQGLLYTEWKCFENSSAISQASIKCLPSTSSLIQLNSCLFTCKLNSTEANYNCTNCTRNSLLDIWMEEFCSLSPSL